MPHPNEEVIRQAVEYLNQGNMEAFLGMNTEDVVGHVPGRGPIAGDYRGAQEVAGLFQRQVELLDQPPSLELHDVVANDQHGVILGINHFRRAGAEHAARVAIVLHLRDGKASEFWVHPEDQYAIDEFFS